MRLLRELVLPNLVPLANLLIALANLLFVWIGFRFARRDRQRDLQRTRELFWFQEIIVKTHMDAIREFFDVLLDAARRLGGDPREAGMITQQAAHKRFREALSVFMPAMDDIDCIDGPLAKKLREQIVLFQTDFSGTVEHGDSVQVQRVVRRARERFLHTLHATHRRCVDD